MPIGIYMYYKLRAENSQKFMNYTNFMQLFFSIIQ